MPVAPESTIAWGLSLVTHSTVRAFVLTACGREEEGVLRRSMTTLCYELQLDPSTVRRVISYLEDVGAIERLTRGGGAGALQELRLCTEVPAANITRAMAAHPYHPRNSRTDARVSEPQPAHRSSAPVRELAQPAHGTIAQNPRTGALVSPTRAQNQRTGACVELNPLPGSRLTTSTPVKELNNQEPLKAAEVVKQPGSTGIPGSAWHETPPPQELLAELHSTWDTKFPDGTEEVDRRLGVAIAHESRRKSSGWKPYLDGWLQGDYDHLPTALRRNGSGNSHRPASANSPFATAAGHTSRFAALQEESRRASMPKPTVEETVHADAG